MTRVGYHVVTGSIFLVAIAGAAAVWLQADRVHHAGNQGVGWTLGVAGVALPFLGLLACSAWLRRERRHGRHAAQIWWLKGALVVSAVGGVAIALWSLM